MMEGHTDTQQRDLVRLLIKIRGDTQTASQRARLSHKTPFISSIPKVSQKLRVHRGNDEIIYRVSQEEYAILREGVPYVKIYRYNPKHLCPKLNGYGI
jgi:hypothetical protein